MRGVRSAEPKTTPERVAPASEDTSKRQEVFKDWLANYLRRLDRVSEDESTFVEQRPAARDGSMKNVKRKPA
jgi:hypothetical protein